MQSQLRRWSVRMEQEDGVATNGFIDATKMQALDPQIIRYKL